MNWQKITIQTTAKYCIPYFDDYADLNLFENHTISYCMSKSQPKAKESTNYNLGYVLSLQDISNEITRHLPFTDILTISLLNRALRATTSTKLQFVLTPAEFANPTNSKRLVALQSNLKITVKIPQTPQDSQNITHLTHLIQRNHNQFLPTLETIQLTYVSCDTQNPIQTLLNLIPTHLSCLANLSFRGIWKPIIFPYIKLNSLVLGKIWASITFSHHPQLSFLHFEKTTAQPATQKMLKDLQASINC